VSKLLGGMCPNAPMTTVVREHAPPGNNSGQHCIAGQSTVRTTERRASCCLIRASRRAVYGLTTTTTTLSGLHSSVAMTPDCSTIRQTTDLPAPYTARR